ncbi:hypothetical protein [Neolewinella persica]|uniref:hypothetical protein n=1 Tax=Neolewinella persica TaxID=70998 RepID=UPI00037722A9|nr:hypothetical protein [Neolewinella persica]
MQIQYEPLASIRLRHDYFQDGNCPVISLVPAVETERAMQKLGIRMVARDFGTELFYNVGSMPGGQLLQTEDLVQLSFILRSTDPLFHNYTLPEDEKSATDPRFFNNLETNGPAIDLPGNWRDGDLGLLTIYIGETESGETKILDNGVVTPGEYTIAFAVRSTRWRYHLIDSGNTGYTNFQLLDIETRQPIPPPANSPSTKQMPDGSTAVLLTTEIIPLRQRPGARFLLSMEMGGTERTTPTTINLPSADASHISRDDSPTPDTSGDPVFYSDMYVYL